MQTFLWQSPGFPPETKLPFGAFVLLHMPAALQLNVLHVVLVPHWLFCVHSTQAGALMLPLHIVPPPWLQATPAASGGFDWLPFVQTSAVHWFPSTGTSRLSAASTTVPVPLQTFVL